MDSIPVGKKMNNSDRKFKKNNIQSDFAPELKVYS